METLVRIVGQSDIFFFKIVWLSPRICESDEIPDQSVPGALEEPKERLFELEAHNKIVKRNVFSRGIIKSL